MSNSREHQDYSYSETETSSSEDKSGKKVKPCKTEKPEKKKFPSSDSDVHEILAEKFYQTVISSTSELPPSKIINRRERMETAHSRGSAPTLLHHRKELPNFSFNSDPTFQKKTPLNKEEPDEEKKEKRKKRGKSFSLKLPFFGKSKNGKPKTATSSPSSKAKKTK